MLARTTRQYATMPNLPGRGPLPPMVSVIVPLARTNLITNPSVELATTGYTAVGGSIARVATQQYHGTYSLEITPSAGTNSDGAFYGTVSLTTGIPYAYSVKFKATGTGIGKTYALSIATTGGTDLSVTQFVATGRWQWIRGIYGETATNSRRVYIRKVNHSAASAFYTDGWQVESCADGVLDATTYIDGDQQGLLIGQQPLPYLWTGTPHASTSTRSALTRAGGYVVNLSFYNFLLAGIVGLGMAVPNNVSIPYTVLDGARYQRTQKPPRTIALAGRFQADNVYELMQSQSDMRAVFDRDLSIVQQPLVLQVEPQDECGNVIGDFANIQCLYAGGLEGNDSNYPAEDAAPTFTMYLPYLIGGDAGVALSPQSSVSNANYILQRSPTGVWSAMGTGASGNPVLALARGLDGKIYAGGAFTSIGGVANTNQIAYWDPTDLAWHAMGTGAAGGNVATLTVGADGSVYAGGTFTSMGGVANTNNIARWNGSAWNAMGTGVTGGSSVSIVLAAKNGLVYAGGAFTAMGGVANTARIASWNGSAWSALSTGAPAGTVMSMAWGPDNRLYVGGSFTTIGGVAINRIARWNGTAFSDLTTAGGANSDVRDMAFAPNGFLYIAGAFTQVGGQNTGQAAKWNGVVWSTVSSYYNGTMQSVAVDAQGIVYFGAGGAISGAPGWLPDQSLSRYIGTDTIIGLDIDLPSTNVTAYDWLFLPDGTLILAFGSNGTATSAATVTATNNTPGVTYPTLTINGPTSGSARLYQLVNYTTSTAMYFDYTMQAGEVATLITDPRQPSFISNFQGDLTSKLLPGSSSLPLYLAPGANTISLFGASSTMTAPLGWQNRYNGLADLVN